MLFVTHFSNCGISVFLLLALLYKHVSQILPISFVHACCLHVFDVYYGLCFGLALYFGLWFGNHRTHLQNLIHCHFHLHEISDTTKMSLGPLTTRQAIRNSSLQRREKVRHNGIRNNCVMFCLLFFLNLYSYKIFFTKLLPSEVTNVYVKPCIPT